MTRKLTYAWARVFRFLIKFFFKNMSFLKIFFKNYGLWSFQATTRTSKIWLAITSDSNPVFKIKENTSPKRRLFLLPGEVHLGMDYFISMFPRSNVRFSALFLDKEEKSSFYRQYFPFYHFSGKCLCKTWWYHEILIENQNESKFW